jgi:predicted MFS family arabinose efflux permease
VVTDVAGLSAAWVLLALLLFGLGPFAGVTHRRQVRRQ